MKILFEERGLRLKELKTLVLELRIDGPSWDEGGPLKHSVQEIKTQEKVWIKGTWCDKNAMC